MKILLAQLVTKIFTSRLLFVTFFGAMSLCSISTSSLAAEHIKFKMVPSNAVLSCLPEASATVRVVSIGGAEIMYVSVKGLPPSTEFDFFVIQTPNPPFGLSWYQGDIETNSKGRGRGKFIGRFNIETFIVAPESDVAPLIHDDAFADAGVNPATEPVHTLHLGLWFNSPDDALEAGCPGNVTPFNGEHNAGIQVLNTSNFENTEGPLLFLEP